jgi:hypothetical protein
MRNISVVKKIKEKKTYMLDSMEELKGLDFKKILPTNAKKVELMYKDSQGILVIDYILELSTSKED